jgi:hypothetical protein
MQYAQTPRDSLEHLSYMPVFDTGLGQYMEAAMLAMNAMDDGGGADTKQSEGMPGSEQSVPRQPSSMNTVSTAVVTQVSPQISPVMTQQQSSPGATVGANPMQFMPGGLSADTAISPFGNYADPAMPGSTPGISPYQPYTYDRAGGGYVPIDPVTGQPITGGYLESSGGQYSPVRVGGSTMQDLPWIPIALVGGGIALALFLSKRKVKR